MFHKYLEQLDRNELPEGIKHLLPRLETLDKQAGEPCEYQSVLTESADNLYNVLKELNDTDYLVERLYVYAYMRYYEDTANSVYQDMSGRVQTAAAKCAEKYAFVEPAILSMDENVLYEYLKDDRLKLYKHMIDDMMEIAVRMFPENETANLNAAITRLNAGDVDNAKQYLDKAGTSADAQNARGVYEMLKGNEKQARYYLEQAAKAGVASG